MTQIIMQDDINQLINKMNNTGITPPDIKNEEGFFRFNTEGCLNNSGYCHLTEGIRTDKSNYLMASFGCFDRGINEWICTLTERPLGADEKFYSDSYTSHQLIIKQQKERYLNEIKVGKQIAIESIKQDKSSNSNTIDVQENVHQNSDVDMKNIMKTKEPVVNSFVAYDGFYKALEYMPDDKTRLEYLDAIFYYGLFRETKEQSDYVKTMFALIKPQMDINFKRKKDGANGGRPKKVKAS